VGQPPVSVEHLWIVELNRNFSRQTVFHKMHMKILSVVTLLSAVSTVFVCAQDTNTAPNTSMRLQQIAYPIGSARTNVRAAAATNSMTTTGRILHYLEAFPGPQAYRDADSGIVFYVESDGRHVAAISSDAKVLWNKDPIADAQLKPNHAEFYRVNNPRIISIGKATEPQQQYAQRMTEGGRGKFVAIAYENSQFGVVDIKTGDFIFCGQY
jgi:hypothetical protein